jgi:hypothetical protein
VAVAVAAAVFLMPRKVAAQAAEPLGLALLILALAI